MFQLTEQYAAQVVTGLLPPGAEIARIDYPASYPAVLAVDLDGDRNPEIVGVYRTAEGMRALIAKHSLQGWYVFSHIRGPGYGIANLAAAPIAGVYPPSLLIGWQIGERWAQLDLFQFEAGEYRHLTPSDVFYSRLAIVPPAPPVYGREADAAADRLLRLALWTHDREEAYRVELVRWQGDGLVRDEQAYPAYFANAVIPYYAGLLNVQPDSELYRACWEEASRVAGAASS
ncbi:hypothetical protein [Cohnella fermenti]|uniref:Uncharacterized protein n=1 Tax=Cohnella fermenti TaxID=2565925 RepID=A0A4S4BPN6_9BACL|nr:hypothetical protein [Cohnella fermenti]THF76345.1 hypothetical protein E6C55_18890 [Cohnella fermenti]